MHRYLKPLRWLSAAASLVFLMILAWQCVDIYTTGNQSANLDANGVYLLPVYRMEDVSARINQYGAVLCGAVLLLTIIALLHAVFSEPAAERYHILPENHYRLLKARMDRLPEVAKAEERLRAGVRCIEAFVLIVCAVGCMVFLLDRSNFVSWELELVLRNMLHHIFPWMMIAFVALMISSIICDRSFRREIVILKGEKLTKPGTQRRQQGRTFSLLKVALLVIAIVFIVLGVMNGGWYDVLVKAINICTECIGLG